MEMSTVENEVEEGDLQCKVCGAHATGFHFGAQSCSACCAFFRRAISLKRAYKCGANGDDGSVKERGVSSIKENVQSCSIIYTERKLCRACRLRKCFDVGMKKSCVQGPKSLSSRMRAYCTKSGLQRNKRFSMISNVDSTVWRKEYGSSVETTTVDDCAQDISSTEKIHAKIVIIEGGNDGELLNDDINNTDVTTTVNTVFNNNDAVKTFKPNDSNSKIIFDDNGTRMNNDGQFSPLAERENDTISGNHFDELSTKCFKTNIDNSPKPLSETRKRKRKSTQIYHQQSSPAHFSSTSTPSIISSPISSPMSLTTASANLLDIFVLEEMKIAERRRILFCERPVGSLLGNTKSGPFTIHDIKPLDFHEFRRSIRIHILLIYEWLRVFPYYSSLCKHDQLTFLRKSVLYHTILDPCYITVQIGDLSKFVLQNGGYVSTIAQCDDGWHDEKEISRDNKKKIYWPLLNRLMTDIIEQMVNLKLEFEEFVAVKALVSIQMTICDASKAGQLIMKQASNEICRALSRHYQIANNLDKAARFGNIILLLSPIFDSATNFVESHHQVQFFDLWQIDSLLLQFLKNKV